MTMRRNILILGLAIATGWACSSAPAESDEPAEELAGQSDHTDGVAIPDVPEPTFTDGTPDVDELGEYDGVSAFRVGEVDVVHMPTPANEVVAARLYLRGGSALLNESLEGIEQLALSVATGGGTESTPKDEFNAQLDAVGSSIGYTANRDFSGYTMRSVRDHFDETWELFEEAVFEPAFDDDEVELRRDRQLASIRSIVENPDRLVSEVARDLAFGDHPYYFRQRGTEDTVSGFTTEQLQRWHNTMLAPERMLLVVVGNVDRDELIDRVGERFGRLEPTGFEVPSLPHIEPEVPAQRVEQMELPTNYILSYFAAPTLGDPDFAALMLATRHLRDRLFEEVRTKRNLTYSVSSSVGQRGANVGYLYVTAVDPEATIPVMLQEVEKLQSEPVDEQDLEKVRNVFLTRHYMDQETNASIAATLGRAELVGGDWRLGRTFRNDIMDVTPEDIQRVAREYIHNHQVGVVGDAEEVPPALFGVETEYAETVDEIDDLEDVDEQPEADDHPDPDAGTPDGEPTDVPQ